MFIQKIVFKVPSQRKRYANLFKFTHFFYIYFYFLSLLSSLTSSFYSDLLHLFFLLFCELKNVGKFPIVFKLWRLSRTRWRSKAVKIIRKYWQIIQISNHCYLKCINQSIENGWFELYETSKFRFFGKHFLAVTRVIVLSIIKYLLLLVFASDGLEITVFRLLLLHYI